MKAFLTIGLLRLVTGFGQFAVVLFLAVALSIADLGAYSLLVIFVGYGTQVAGLAFYAYVTREIVLSARENWPGILFQKWAFLLSSTTLVALAIFVAEALGLVAIPGLGIFVALLALSVFNTQHENLLIAIGRPLGAALNLLVRTSWIYALILAHLLAGSSIQLEHVYLAWIAAEALAALFVLANLWRERILPTRRYPLDVPWLKRGVRVGAQFAIMGLLLLVTVTVQRVVLGGVEDATLVGIMHFFFVISTFGPNLLEASLYAVILPRLITSAKVAGNPLALPPLWIFALLPGCGVLGLAVLYMILPFALPLIGKPELTIHMSIFWFTAAYALLYTTARIFHYTLYAAGEDQWLLSAYAVACAAATGSSIVLVKADGLNGALWSLVIAGATLLLVLVLPFFWRGALRRFLL